MMKPLWTMAACCCLAGLSACGTGPSKGGTAPGPSASIVVGITYGSGPTGTGRGLVAGHVTATASNGAEYVADVGNGARGTIRVPVGKYAVTAQSGSALCVAQIVVAVSGSSQVVTVGCSVK
jgi:hypothetical protein